MLICLFIGHHHKSQTSKAHFAKILQGFDLLDEFLGLIRVSRAQKPEYIESQQVKLFEFELLKVPLSLKRTTIQL